MKAQKEVNETSKDKLTNWKNEPTVAELQQDYNMAKSSQSEQVAKISDWLDQLNVDGTYKPKKREGRSSIQPKLIRKQAEWRYASLSEPFLNDENVFSISPKTFMDREAARQNELILNYQFNMQLDKTNLIDTMVRTGVNEGTTIIRIGWDFQEAKVTELVDVYDYVEATPEQYQTISRAMQLIQSGQTTLEQLPEYLQESINASEMNGRPISAVIIGSEEQEVTKVVKNQPNLTICDYQNITIDPTCDGIFDKANFVVYSFETNRSELNAAGIYSNIDKIKEVDPNNGDHADLDSTSFRFSDKTRKKLTVYEYWGYWDIDNSGVVTPIVAAWCDDIMIRMEVNPFPDRKLPFVVIPYLPVKNSVYGEPDASLLEDNQKLIGALTRGMVDAMARSANAQTGMRKDALDAVNLRKYKAGEDYYFNQGMDPRLATIQHSYPELPASTFNMLQMFNQESEAMTGVQTFSSGITGDALGSTAAGVQGVIGASGKRELGILRRFANGMQEIGRKILAMNSEWLTDDEMIRITDEEFIQVNRDNLSGSFDIKLSISNAETDNIKAQELSFMLQTMGSVLPFDMTKIILSEIAKLRNMPDLSKMIKQHQPQPDPMQEIELQQAQLAMQKTQAELQLAMADIQLKQAQIQQVLANARKLTTDANMNDLDFVEQESGVKQERELELQQAQAQGNLKRDITKSILGSSLKDNKETTK